MQTFIDQLKSRIRDSGSHVCVGFDPDPDKMPPLFSSTPTGIFSFALKVLEEGAPYSAIIKPNLAFWACRGAFRELKGLIGAAQELGLQVILDCKSGDIGNTAKAYAKMAFEYFGADAATLNAYLGTDTLEPWLNAGPTKAGFVLAHTSNPGAAKFQEKALADGVPLFVHIAEAAVACQTEQTAAMGLVMGATFPDQIGALANIPDGTLMLLPGIGKQEGDLAATVSHARRFELVVNSSSGITHASEEDDFAEAAGRAAEKLRDEINAAMKVHI